MKVTRRFIDTLRIYVRGGRGGNGLPKYGGVGGKGGDVYAEACENYNLKKILSKCPNKRFLAGAGEDSKKYMILGKDGSDVFIKCPTGVSVVSDTKRVIGDLNEAGDKILLASGGCGGCMQNDFLGQKGQAHSVTLDLKLIADVGFVGFPNAGKSTLLHALSRAKPKIASYPFTTIHPSLGIMEYEDFRVISAADLPGLIEGAHMNYGMGHKFLKHCVRTKVLLFVVDINGFRLSPNHAHRSAFETVLLLNKELELYEKDMVFKPAILAVNKIDEDPHFEKMNCLKRDLSLLKDNLDDIPKELRPEDVIKFDAIIPISAKNNQNISELKAKIRTIIDVYHEKKIVEEQKKSVSLDVSESVIYV